MGLVTLLVLLSQEAQLVSAQDVPATVVSEPAPSVQLPATSLPAGWVNLEVDYLWWVPEKMRVPALLTTGPATSPAILGEPGTTVLYGDDRIDSRFGRAIGVRGRFDLWLDADETIGLHGTAFFLERDSSNKTFDYNTISPLARPYTDALDGSQRTLIVAGNVPGLGTLAGGFNAYSRNELYGEDLNGQFLLARTEDWEVCALAGGRFLQMRERLDLTGTSKLLPTEAALFGVTDDFNTFDKFYGFQVGLLGQVRLFDRLSLLGKATFALGADDQKIVNSGNRVIAVPGFRETLDYGLLVEPANSGSFERAAFDTVSEVSLTLNYQLTQWLAFRIGYSFLTWDNPVRPGDQIVPVNPTQVGSGLSGTVRPSVPFREDFFWAQGGHVGMVVSW